MRGDLLLPLLPADAVGGVVEGGPVLDQPAHHEAQADLVAVGLQGMAKHGLRPPAPGAVGVGELGDLDLGLHLRPPLGTTVALTTEVPRVPGLLASSPDPADRRQNAKDRYGPQPDPHRNLAAPAQHAAAGAFGL